MRPFSRWLVLPLTIAGLSLGLAHAVTAPVFLDALPEGPDSGLSLKGYVLPGSADIGKPVSLFVVALLPGVGSPVFALTPQGWVKSGLDTVPPFASGLTASESHTLDVLAKTDIRSLAGTSLFVGYGVEGTTSGSAFADMLQNGKYRLVSTLKTTQTQNGPATLTACPADISTPLFNTLPIALDDFIAFRPLGFLSTPIHQIPAKHSAFSMTAPGASPVQKPVRAPSKVTVTEIYEATFTAGNKNYQVFMHPCREVRLYFGHVAKISDKLLAEFAKGTPKCNSFNDGSGTTTTCRRENLTLQLDEGEIFGEGPDLSGVDLGVLDFRLKPAAFIYPQHYDSFYVQYASPLDYFTPTVKDAFAAKFGSVFGANKRTAGPIGGSYMQDILGTAKGNWFLPGKFLANTTDLTNFLGLSHDFVDPTLPVMAAGTNIKGMKLGVYSYKPASTGFINRDFADIKNDGNAYCIDGFTSGRTPGEIPLGTVSGVLLMKLLNEVTLKVELIAASTCTGITDKAFTESATVFVR